MDDLGAGRRPRHFSPAYPVALVGLGYWGPPPDTTPATSAPGRFPTMASGPDPTADGEPILDVHDPGHHQPGHTAAPVPLPHLDVMAAAGELLRALSAPLRIAIVLQLREGPRCVHELVDALGVAQPLVSQHLKVLKSSHVVSAHRQGREIRYELLDDHLVHIVEAAVGHAGEG